MQFRKLVTLTLLILTQLMLAQSSTVKEINQTLSSTHFSNNSYFDLLPQDVLKYVNQSTTSVIPIRSIEYTEVVPFQGKYYVSVRCGSQNLDCVEKYISGQHIANDNYFDLTGSTSLSHAEDVSSFLMDLVRQTNSKSLGAENNSGRQVFICYSSNAYAYHSNNSCEGLNNCRRNIYKVDEKNARIDGYRYCRICWE